MVCVLVCMRARGHVFLPTISSGRTSCPFFKYFCSYCFVMCASVCLPFLLELRTSYKIIIFGSVCLPAASFRTHLALRYICLKQNNSMWFVQCFWFVGAIWRIAVANYWNSGNLW
jgi:hypothetical protein